MRLQWNQRNQRGWMALCLVGALGACQMDLGSHGQDTNASVRAGDNPGVTDVVTPGDDAAVGDTGVPTGNDGSTTVLDAGVPMDAGTSMANTCSTAIPLVPGVVLAGQQTPATGTAATACRVSGAPQGYYSFDIPVGQRATIRVVPEGAPWTAVARVYDHCDESNCITDNQSDTPGMPVTLVVDNPFDSVLHKTLTVSSDRRRSGGSFSVLVELGPVYGGGDSGTMTGTDAGTMTGTDSGTMTGTDAGTMTGTDSGTMTGSDAGTPAGGCSLAQAGALHLPTDAVDGTLSAGNNIPSTRCGTTDGGEAIYTLHLDTRIGVDIQGTGGVTSLALRRACEDMQSELVCHIGGYTDWEHYPHLRRVLDPGDYYVIADQFHVGTTTTFHLALTTFVPPPESACETAPELAPNVSVVVDSHNASTPNATCYPSDAPQSFERFTIPAHQRALIVAHRASGNYNSLPVVRVMDACGDNSCVTYGRAYSFDASTTRVTVDNPGDAPRTVIISLSSQGMTTEGQLSMTVSLLALPAYAPNAVCTNATVITDGTRLMSEDSTTASNRVECRAEEFTGNDLYYRASIPSGQVLNVAFKPRTYNADVAMRVMDSCDATTCDQVTNGEGGTPEIAHLFNDSGAPREVVFAVGASTLPPGGLFDVSSSIRVPASNAACATPMQVHANQTVTGEDYATGWTAGPRPAALPSTRLLALYYQINVPANSTLTVHGVPTGESRVNLILTTGCDTQPLSAVVTPQTDGSAQLSYTNTTGMDQQITTVSYASDGQVAGTFDLSFQVSP